MSEFYDGGITDKLGQWDRSGTGLNLGRLILLFAVQNNAKV